MPFKQLVVVANAFLIMLSGALSAASAADRENLLNIQNGAVLLTYSSQYDNHYSAFAAFDDDPKSTWCSMRLAAKNQSFVLELPHTYRLDKIKVDNSSTQESSYPGISAKVIELWGSTTSEQSGFTKLASIQAAKHAVSAATIGSNAQARWLKIVLVSNWGNHDYTEVSDIFLSGTPLGKKPAQLNFTGSFVTNWGCLKFNQVGSNVSGCYPYADGKFTGTVDGNVVRFDWSQPGGNSGTATMSVNHDGSFIDGFYRQRGTDSLVRWYGKRYDHDCNCIPAAAGKISD
ncbi:MAG TPA: discoidin domain-containing protein [Trichormus sp.]|jgi:hypothetical protein